MLKNEEQRISVTLNSLKGQVDSVIVYDTGSTDRTIEILQEFCDTHRIPLRLKTGEFTHFAESRNVALDFADTFGDVDFLILLDCNDELKGGKELRAFAESAPKEKTAWLTRQLWFHGTYTDFYNIRFLRPRCHWRYHGVVHEWIQKLDQPDVYVSEKISPTVHIYQDRTQDDDKSGKRFHRDKVLLLDEHKAHPEDERTVFYLAQTCACLHDYEEAFQYYEIRSKMNGFHEEVFQSLLRMGELIPKLQKQGKTTYTTERMVLLYLDAFNCIPRVEPLLVLAEHYRQKEHWMTSYMFAKMACDLEPTTCILFVNAEDYAYKRFHILGIVAFYCGKYNEGREACLKAIRANGPHIKIDEHNLKFYNEKLQIQPAIKVGGRRLKRR